ncbi:MAG TPA: APC family permease [Solirubrobacteraceae bacterium]|jgi:amino acid transporter|nr:APC family permease [Solirubrobacteraceae bacterium]
MSARREPARGEEQKLGLLDVTASTVANIGPGIDFYFAFGVIAVTAGIAAPLTIIVSGIAAFFLAFIVAEFTRMEPSAGSFITYVETAFGPRAGVLVAWLLAVGFTVAIVGVFAMSGGMISLTLDHYTSWHPSWLPLALITSAGALALTLRGASLSTTAIGIGLVVQILVMLATCLVVLVDQRHHLSATPFSWSHLHDGLTGLSAGFPLALYMFIGWENAPALAEETRDPRRTIPRALYIGLVFATGLFVLFAYTTISGFHYKTASIGRASVPFLEMADHYLGDAAILAWLVGILSVLSTLVAAVNSQARVLFDGGRSRLLPRWLGKSRPPGKTPVNAVLMMAVVGLGIVVTWWLCHVTGLVGGTDDPVKLYGESGTMGTILILFVYVLTAGSLPVFIRRRHRASFSVPRHVLMPALGALVLVIPFVELFRPGQPVPYNVFPYLAVAILSAAGAIAWVVVRRDPQAGAGEGAPLKEG